MPDTLIEKILRGRSGGQAAQPGDIRVCDVDLVVLIDIQFAHDRLADVVEVFNPDRVAIVMDHAVPAPSIRDADSGRLARDFARAHNITRFYDVGRHGIVHQVIAEQGLARPATVIACTDSHTCAAGAFASAARGLGPAEVLQIVCSGRTWYQVPPTIRYELTGQQHPLVNGKDIFLHVAGTYGDATAHAIEFGGPGVASVPMSDRRTICTQGAEVGADFTLFPADEVCLDFLARSEVGGELTPFGPDSDAEYESVRGVNLSLISPMVGLPGTVIDNAEPVGHVVGQSIDQAFIGSCANGQLADLAVAAAIVRGKQVAPTTRLIVTPASQRIYVEAARLGYLADLAEAGATVTNPTCGACFGYHMGVVGDGEVCLTSSTRNFRGRMGSTGAQIFMASPATVATSALRGEISDVREIDASTLRLGASA